MTDTRLTVRFSEEEMRKIAGQAEALGMTRADVVRLAVESLFSAQRTAQQLADMRGQMLDELRHEINQARETLSTQQRRTAMLILKVANAPREAEEALEKIFKG